MTTRRHNKKKFKRLIIAPEWRLVIGSPMRVMFLESLQAPESTSRTNKPLYRARVRSIDTDEIGTLLITRKLRNLLTDAGYGVGRSFEILRHVRKPSDRSSAYTVFEI